MSDTPRTDGAVFVVFSSPSNDVEAVDADFARELERENEFLLKSIERLADDLERLAKRLGNGLESVQKKEAKP